MTAEWTEYSDSASLPMSKAYRDQLRERLLKLNIASLKDTDRAKVERLLKALDVDVHDQPDDGVTFASSLVQKNFLYAMIIGFAYFIFVRFRTRNITVPTSDDVRKARADKYE